MTTRDRILQILKDHLPCDPEQVIDSARLVDDLGADSLDTVTIAFEFEDAFGIAMPDNAADGLLTVGDCVAAMERRLGVAA